MKKMKASREEIDQSIKEAFNMNRKESNERTERKVMKEQKGKVLHTTWEIQKTRRKNNHRQNLHQRKQIAEK
ncbi:hypothetical protein [Prevotella veroralis]|uniref:hypothetical protein n=1 Tax=Prevotella veroralis TaxID=28137 RepID=UPI0003A1AC4C|nr:hypothetical protein [Prevotella veroralis]